ncbi:hypothetical protein EIP91_011658 [Steccherinum ochraceum]|uniref:SnodProt1 n=1 Tax=Steccherinum ochraceum TaxID=92696 RepID=A0A4R0RRC5_9APHY|nr:hypothetical protein EIP91_011658 [Steccherinum ochraceum]
MQLTNALAFVLVIAAPAFAIRVSSDSIYDNAKTSMAGVACSNGDHGLMHKYPTFGSLHNFPNIGGAAAIGSWNSAKCGSCWQLTYKGRSINVLAIDHTGEGFNLSKAAMNKLTNGRADELGVVDASSKEVPASVCGL